MLVEINKTDEEIKTLRKAVDISHLMLKKLDGHLRLD